MKTLITKFLDELEVEYTITEFDMHDIPTQVMVDLDKEDSIQLNQMIRKYINDNNIIPYTEIVYRWEIIGNEQTTKKKIKRGKDKKRTK